MIAAANCGRDPYDPVYEDGDYSMRHVEANIRTSFGSAHVAESGFFASFPSASAAAARSLTTLVSNRPWRMNHSLS